MEIVVPTTPEFVRLDKTKAARVIGTCEKIIDISRQKGIGTVCLRMTYSPDLSDGGGPEDMVINKNRPNVLSSRHSTAG